MLYYNTVSTPLKDMLLTVMQSPVFESFRLVGGTALSLQLGHRISIDIDLFSDVPYGNINFKAIDAFIEGAFAYHDHLRDIVPAMGKSYSIGPDKDHVIKLDVFYTDTFIQVPLLEDTIRMATTEEIIAMKIDVIQRGGRKKDFWDLHELLPNYDIDTMLSLHEKRYPYNHNRKLIVQNLTNFKLADNDFDPICLRGKYWEFIKEDIEETVKDHT